MPPQAPRGKVGPPIGQRVADVDGDLSAELLCHGMAPRRFGTLPNQAFVPRQVLSREMGAILTEERSARKGHRSLGPR